MMHMITTVINQMDEMRITHNEKGQLGIWNYLSPCYTVFHDDDKTFTNIWTEYNQHFTEFNNCFLHDSEQYGKIKKFIAKDHEPGNTFPVSCIPWLDFTAFNLNIYDDANYLSPIFTIGKYKKRDNTIVIPVAVQVHHAVCDGYHASVLFEKIKSLAAQPELWMR